MIVRVDSGAGTLSFEDQVVPCAIGRGGACAADAKREGDGRTPIGDWRITGALIRPDRGFAPPPSLPWRWLRADDGWCDAPGDVAYNRAVRHPHPASAEHLWRDDDRYDAIVTIDHNSAPPIAGAGSAIFLHIGGDRPTEGCVAIARPAMVALLALLTGGSRLTVAAAGVRA